MVEATDELGSKRLRILAELCPSSYLLIFVSSYLLIFLVSSRLTLVHSDLLVFLPSYLLLHTLFMLAGRLLAKRL